MSYLPTDPHVAKAATIAAYGERWSTQGSVTAPRLFTSRREGPLREVLDEAGWAVVQAERHDGRRGDRRLQVMGTRKDA